MPSPETENANYDGCGDDEAMIMLMVREDTLAGTASNRGI